MESTIKKLTEDVEELQEKFNELLEKLNNAKISSVMTFEELEIEQDFPEEEDIVNEEVNNEEESERII